MKKLFSFYLLIFSLILLIFSCTNNSDISELSVNAEVTGVESKEALLAFVSCDDYPEPPESICSEQPISIDFYETNCLSQTVYGNKYLSPGEIFPFDGYVYNECSFKDGGIGVTIAGGELDVLDYVSYNLVLEKKIEGVYIEEDLFQWTIYGSCSWPNCPPVPSQYLPGIFNFNGVGEYRISLIIESEGTTPILQSSFEIVEDPDILPTFSYYNPLEINEGEMIFSENYQPYGPIYPYIDSERPMEFSVYPALPDGMNFDASSGIIYGLAPIVSEDYYDIHLTVTGEYENGYTYSYTFPIIVLNID